MISHPLNPWGILVSTATFVKLFVILPAWRYENAVLPSADLSLTFQCLGVFLEQTVTVIDFMLVLKNTFLHFFKDASFILGKMKNHSYLSRITV